MNLEEEVKAIELCKKDLSFFEPIYREYMPDVFRYVQSKTHNREITEEVVSRTFIKAMENISKYQFQDKSIKCWLFIIARNDLYAKYREIKSSVTLDEDIEIDQKEETQILNIIIKDEEYKRIITELEKSSPKQIEIIRLKHWEDLKFDEIAKILNMSTGSVKMQYYRTLRNIKLMLEENVTF